MGSAAASAAVPTTPPLQPSARVCVYEVYENERRPFTRFSWAKGAGVAASGGFHYTTLLPTDRKRWSTGEGDAVSAALSSSVERSADPPPPGNEAVAAGETSAKMTWMEKEWRVVIEPGRTDEAGWEYAFNWGRAFSAQAVREGVAADFVRRRRWQRRAARALV
jgi:hypothetical protein